MNNRRKLVIVLGATASLPQAVFAQAKKPPIVIGFLHSATPSERIVKFALAQRWPVVAGPRVFVEAGALLSYSADTATQYRRAAYFVDRILKGAKPGDLPIEQPMTFELVVNQTTAKALGLPLSPEITVRATQLIQ